MLYEKNGITRDSKKFLECSDGRIVFNATRDQWEAEGWKEYEPLPVPAPKKSLEEIREEQLIDAKNFFDSLFEGELSREDRVYYRQLAQDLLDQDVTSARLFLPDDTREYDLNKVLDFFKEFSLLEFQNREILQMHLSNLKNLKTEKELVDYDYTADYSVLPDLKYARKSQ